jgi:uncharacterized protein YidB (DUF937 family)
MGLFDIAGELLGSAEGSNNQNALSTVLSLVNNHPGGLAGLVSAFEQNGLGGVVQSWVSPGPNQPVSGEQVQSALGSDKIEEVAAKLGVPPAIASSIVAEVLPGIVSHLSANGQVASGQSNLMEMGEGLLKNFMK